MDLELSYLYQVFGEAGAIYFRAAPNRDIHLTPHAYMAAAGEPYADFNQVLIDHSRDADAQLRMFYHALQARNLPALYLLTPAAADPLAATVQTLGLTFAGKAPVMVCAATDVRNTTTGRYTIKQVENAEGLAAVCHILVHAFNLAEDALRRVLSITTLAGPGLTMYLAYEAGQPISTVATTVCGALVGVWSMGTLPVHQRKGAGRALLAQVMAHHRAQGAQNFYLWSTEAGRRLYDQLGYRTVTELAVWTTGQSVQLHA